MIWARSLSRKLKQLTDAKANFLASRVAGRATEAIGGAES